MGTTSGDRMTEIWRPVPGWPYSVSARGEVRSDRYGRILRPALRPTGYLQVTLSRRNEHWHPFVHQLVLLAFVGPAPEGTECCHGNGNRTDNRLSNLRWDTRLANAADATAHGTGPGARTHCPRGHDLAEPNLTASGVATGRRRCLACSRGRSYVRNHQARYGEHFTEPQIQAICDGYFHDLPNGAAA